MGTAPAVRSGAPRFCRYENMHRRLRHDSANVKRIHHRIPAQFCRHEIYSPQASQTADAILKTSGIQIRHVIPEIILFIGGIFSLLGLAFGALLCGFKAVLIIFNS